MREEGGFSGLGGEGEEVVVGDVEGGYGEDFDDRFGFRRGCCVDGGDGVRAGTGAGGGDDGGRSGLAMTEHVVEGELLKIEGEGRAVLEFVVVREGGGGL